MQCAPPLIVASNIDEKTLKRDGVCAASLPTTMGIIAGLLVQNALKHLLNFGQVTNYLGYSALTDFFPTLKLKPNPQCEDANCRLRQGEYASRPRDTNVEVPLVEEPVHDDNQWGISLVAESAPEVGDYNVPVAEGVSRAYTRSDEEAGPSVVPTTSASVEELMAQMKSI